MANVLITGGSGYLGGSLLAHLKSSVGEIPQISHVYALVRSGEQGEQVKKHYNAEPLTIDLEDQASITKRLVENSITIVFFLIDASHSDAQTRMIKSLAQVQKETGLQTHFLHTSGAKLFSSHAGFPTVPATSDEDETLYDLQKASKSRFPPMQEAVEANNTIIETAISYGVRAYIFIPCIVYGKGEGFGNQTSIQTVAIVKAAKAARKVYRVDQGKPVWPVCHVGDTTSLYAHLLLKMASGEQIGYNEQGYYLASSGLVAWDDVYSAMAKTLAKHGVIDDEAVVDADEANLRLMAEGLGCPTPFVPVLLGGMCTLEPAHAATIGWKAQYKPEHIMETADDEVELILESMRRPSSTI